MNALAAFCVGTQAGIAPEKICAALERYQTVGMRQNISHRGAYTIIADCYNASPDSMKAALTVLRELPCKGRHIAVLGDMLELGEMSRQLHTLQPCRKYRSTTPRIGGNCAVSFGAICVREMLCSLRRAAACIWRTASI